MKKNLYRLSILMLILIAGIVLISFNKKNSFDQFVRQFIHEYEQIGIPEIVYDYHDYFDAIPSAEKLQKQKLFFDRKAEELKGFKRKSLEGRERVSYDHLQYEIEFNLVRIELESRWVKDGRKIPQNGLRELPEYKAWYEYFVKKYTTLDLDAEQIFKLGQQEVKKCQDEIKKIRVQLIYQDEKAFNNMLYSEAFFIRDKNELIYEFSKIDSLVRTNLAAFIGQVDIPPVYAMEWPQAGANTPPGMYLNRANNSFGRDVFQFNFYGEKYNWRAMEWLYMHEAIPGHHLQFSLREKYPDPSGLEAAFFYPGNFEGWACYVEYFGKDLGLYTEPFAYLGKWEWDLVRSARLVIDAGIHYYGWNHDEAMKYWKDNIPNQDEIAERELTRVTNWVGQALSYKVGADFIFKLKSDWMAKHPNETASDFHRKYLGMGTIPLPVIRENLQ